jgi:Fe-S cluster biosynthesis and repair protein YggX
MWLEAAGRRTLLHNEERLDNIDKKNQYRKLAQIVTKFLGKMRSIIVGMFCFYAR